MVTSNSTPIYTTLTDVTWSEKEASGPLRADLEQSPARSPTLRRQAAAPRPRDQISSTAW